MKRVNTLFEITPQLNAFQGQLTYAEFIWLVTEGERVVRYQKWKNYDFSKKWVKILRLYRILIIQQSSRQNFQILSIQASSTQGKFYDEKLQD